MIMSDSFASISVIFPFPSSPQLAPTIALTIASILLGLLPDLNIPQHSGISHKILFYSTTSFHISKMIIYYVRHKVNLIPFRKILPFRQTDLKSFPACQRNQAVLTRNNTDDGAEAFSP